MVRFDELGLEFIVTDRSLVAAFGPGAGAGAWAAWNAEKAATLRSTLPRPIELRSPAWAPPMPRPSKGLLVTSGGELVPAAADVAAWPALDEEEEA